VCIVGTWFWSNWWIWEWSQQSLIYQSMVHCCHYIRSCSNSHLGLSGDVHYSFHHSSVLYVSFSRVQVLQLDIAVATLVTWRRFLLTAVSRVAAVKYSLWCWCLAYGRMRLWEFILTGLRQFCGCVLASRVLFMSWMTSDPKFAVMKLLHEIRLRTWCHVGKYHEEVVLQIQNVGSVLNESCV